MKWYKRNPDRLNSEIALIKRFYPQVNIVVEKGCLVLHLKIRGRKSQYDLRINYPDEFPYEEPRAYIVKPCVGDAPHQWKDGHLSIHGDAEPPQISGKIILDWSINWIKVYENWLDTGKWPRGIRGQE